MFEEEFLPKPHGTAPSDIPMLDDAERTVLVSIIDAYPLDGFVSLPSGSGLLDCSEVEAYFGEDSFSHLPITMMMITTNMMPRFRITPWTWRRRLPLLGYCR